MTKICAILLMLIGLQSVSAIPFEIDGKWGYKDGNGTVVIEPRYSIAGEYSPEGIAAVVDERGWAYIDEEGTVVIRPHVIDNGPDYFSEGLSRFQKNGKYGFFDTSGNVIIRPKFDFVFPFKESLARICNECDTIQDGEHSHVEGGTWGFIDKQGAIIVPAIYECANDFNKGSAQVVFKGKKIFIDREGKIIQ